MNYRKVFKFYIFSIIFSIIFGIILHFAFNWSNNNLLIASFSAVNESTWEHLKLIFFPMLTTIIISYFYLEDDFKKYLSSKTIGILISISFITIFFYTYSGILGYNLGIINIVSFIISVILSEYATYLLMKSNFLCNTKTSIIILIALLVCFILFTYYPPKIGYFKDPINNTYGIEQNDLSRHSF